MAARTLSLGGTCQQPIPAPPSQLGRVRLNKTAGVDALAGPITVKHGGTVASNCSNQISDASTITSTGASENGRFHRDHQRAYLMTGTRWTPDRRRLESRHAEHQRRPNPKAPTASTEFVIGSGYIDVDNFGPPVITNPPAAPASPIPADAASTVHPAYLTKLAWAVCPPATSYDVYLWLASETKPATPTANVVLTEYTVSPQVLSLSNYKWQVVAKNSVGNTAGPEWTFSTMDRRDISGTLTQSPGCDRRRGPRAFDRECDDIYGGTTAAANVNLNGFQFTINNGGGNTQTYNGAITGPGTLRFQGRGDASWDPEDILLGGTLANSPAGVTLDSGRVHLNKTAGVDALAGPITVNTSGTVRIQLLKSNQINDASTITSTASSGAFYLEMGGFSETISGLDIKTGHQVDNRHRRRAHGHQSNGRRRGHAPRHLHLVLRLCDRHRQRGGARGDDSGGRGHFDGGGLAKLGGGRRQHHFHDHRDLAGCQQCRRPGQDRHAGFEPAARPTRFPRPRALPTPPGW